MRTSRRRPLLAACAAVVLALAAPASAGEPAEALRVPDGLQLGRGAPPPPDGITAGGWLVADARTGEVLAARDAHVPFAPASTLKVLTALALLPAVPPDRVVVPTQAEVDVEGSKVGLLRGVGYTGEELYSALLMVSGNDAANALAGAAGGQEAAAALMNAEAARLGAVDTRAVNPHGLDAPGQVTTAYDLAVLGRAALEVPDVARWATTRRSTMPAAPGQPRFEIVNKNKLLGAYEGALGLKNGYTSSARASFVGAAERDGVRLVVTLLRADPRVMDEAARLLDWGFAAHAADIEPVGALPEAPADEPADGEAGDEKADDGEAGELAAGGPAGPDDGTGAGRDARAASSGTPVDLPVRELAGALLVVAAVATVRPARRRGPVPA